MNLKDTRTKNKELILIQGLNNKYSKASSEMKKRINDKSKFGEFIMGSCITWGRQNLKSDKPLVDSTHDGIFFHSMGCHQLGQLVEWIGMPESVYCKAPNEKDLSIGVLGVERTSSGIAILEFQNGSSFSYSARAAIQILMVLQQDGVVVGFYMVQMQTLKEREEEYPFLRK